MEGKKKKQCGKGRQKRNIFYFSQFALLTWGMVWLVLRKIMLKEPFACSKDCEALPKSDVVIFVQKFNFSRKEKTWKEILQKKKKKGKAVWY